jgi:hypothetical protein
VARATAEAATAATSGDTATAAASGAVSTNAASLETAISCLLDGYHPLDTVHHLLLLACCGSSISSDEHTAAATAASGAGDVSSNITTGASQQLRPTVGHALLAQATAAARLEVSLQLCSYIIDLASVH